MNRLYSATIALALSLHGIAAQADSFSELVKTGLGAKVKSLDHRDPAQLQRLVAAWEKRCGKLKPDRQLECYLPESDVYPGKKGEDRVLLFRGENDLYPTPASAYLARNLIEPNQLCTPGTSPDEMVTKIYDISQELRTYDFYFYHRSLVYDTRDRKWKSKESWNEKLFQDGQITQPQDVAASDVGPVYLKPVEDLPASKGCCKMSEEAPLSISAVEHLGSGENKVKIFDPTSKDKYLYLDPYVSTTRAPMIGIRFAIETSFEKRRTGRMLVISVPRKSIVSGDKRICSRPLPPSGGFIDLKSCNTNTDVYPEGEVDGVMALNPDSIRDSLLIDPTPEYGEAARKFRERFAGLTGEDEQ